MSESNGPQVGQLAAALGVDFHEGNISPANLVQLIRGCRKRGLKVAFAGNCLTKTRAAREADVAISLDPGGLENLDRNPAAILLLEPDLARLGTLYEVAQIHRQRILAAQGSAWIPNLLCVGGAFFFGFTSLATVAITNLGTYSTYARTTASIRSLERQFARARGRHAVHCRFRMTRHAPREKNPRRNSSSGAIPRVMLSDTELESLMEDLVTPATLMPSESQDHVHPDDSPVEPDPQSASTPADAVADAASREIGRVRTNHRSIVTPDGRRAGRAQPHQGSTPRSRGNAHDRRRARLRAARRGRHPGHDRRRARALAQGVQQGRELVRAQVPQDPQAEPLPDQPLSQRPRDALS